MLIQKQSRFYCQVVDDEKRNFSFTDFQQTTHLIQPPRFGTHVYTKTKCRSNPRGRPATTIRDNITNRGSNSPVQAEAEPLPASLLQVLRMWHFLRKCHMRKTCKKSFRSPKATMLTDHPARLNENIAPTGMPFPTGERRVGTLHMLELAPERGTLYNAVRTCWSALLRRSRYGKTSRED